MPAVFGETVVPSTCRNTQPPPWAPPLARPWQVPAGRREVHSAVLPAAASGGACVLGPLLRVWSRVWSGGGGGDALPQRARPASSAWLSDPARSRVGRGGASCPPRSESAASARGLRASLGNWLRQSIGGRQAFFLGDSPSAAPSREGGPWGPGGLPVAAAETRPTRVGILTQGALVHSSVSGFCRLHLRLQSVAPNAVSLSKAELGPICSPGPAAVQTAPGVRPQPQDEAGLSGQEVPQG